MKRLTGGGKSTTTCRGPQRRILFVCRNHSNKLGFPADCAFGKAGPVPTWLARPRRTSPVSQRLQKRDEVGTLLIAEHKAQVRLVVPADIVECRGDAVVEVGRPRGPQLRTNSQAYIDLPTAQRSSSSMLAGRCRSVAAHRPSR